MNVTPPILLACAATFFLSASATTSHAGVRTFKNSEGREIQAEITAVSGDEVSMTLTDGSEFDLPIARFSADDQAFIRDWATKNKNAVPRTAIRLEIKKNQSKIRLERNEGEKKADYKKRQDASDRSQTLYVLNLQNTTRQQIDGVEVAYKIFKNVSRRGFGDDDGSRTEELLVRNEVGTIAASDLKDIELEPFITEDIFIKGDKNKDQDDKRQNETLLGIVVKVSAGGKELYKESLPTNLMARIQQDYERDNALAAQNAERQARSDAAEAEREARRDEREAKGQ